eukprot:TRINITY_DN5150_c0_g1_i4.p1 TRINITY_DN5150_c0_g1~~TRINITY_DN5150_c0_g1_i4.p1  ORF type:complete len:667 (-),score=140.61 TRINITY_DN5150_c0_g1_i4:531-2531(-)
MQRSPAPRHTSSSSSLPLALEEVARLIEADRSHALLCAHRAAARRIQAAERGRAARQRYVAVQGSRRRPRGMQRSSFTGGQQHMDDMCTQISSSAEFSIKAKLSAQISAQHSTTPGAMRSQISSSTQDIIKARMGAQIGAIAQDSTTPGAMRSQISSSTQDIIKARMGAQIGAIAQDSTTPGAMRSQISSSTQDIIKARMGAQIGAIAQDSTIPGAMRSEVSSSTQDIIKARMGAQIGAIAQDSTIPGAMRSEVSSSTQDSTRERLRSQLSSSAQDAQISSEAQDSNRAKASIKSGLLAQNNDTTQPIVLLFAEKEMPDLQDLVRPMTLEQHLAEHRECTQPRSQAELQQHARETAKWLQREQREKERLHSELEALHHAKRREEERAVELQLQLECTHSDTSQQLAQVHALMAELAKMKEATDATQGWLTELTETQATLGQEASCSVDGPAEELQADIPLDGAELARPLPLCSPGSSAQSPRAPPIDGLPSLTDRPPAPSPVQTPSPRVQHDNLLQLACRLSSIQTHLREAELEAAIVVKQAVQGAPSTVSAGTPIRGPLAVPRLGTRERADLESVSRCPPSVKPGSESVLVRISPTRAVLILAAGWSTHGVSGLPPDERTAIQPGLGSSLDDSLCRKPPIEASSFPISAPSGPSCPESARTLPSC